MMMPAAGSSSSSWRCLLGLMTATNELTASGSIIDRTSWPFSPTSILPTCQTVSGVVLSCHRVRLAIFSGSRSVTCPSAELTISHGLRQTFESLLALTFTWLDLCLSHHPQPLTCIDFLLVIFIKIVEKIWTVGSVSRECAN